MKLLLLVLCQGLFLTNNVTFLAINGLVGLSIVRLSELNANVCGPLPFARRVIVTFSTRIRF